MMEEGFDLKKVIDFSLNNKLAIWILSLLVIFMGLYSGLNMKQETMPNINLPNISIMTTYPGAAPNVVSEEVTEPIEQRIQNLEGVELVSSTSLANASSIQLEYDFGTDMDQAVVDLKEAIEQVDLPEIVADPEVTRISFNAFPVIALSLSHEGESLEALSERVKDTVIPELEGISGLSDVQMTGQEIQEVALTFKEKKLTELGLTEETVSQIIEGSDLIFPLGLTQFDDQIKNVVIDGNVNSLEDLKALEIPITENEALIAQQMAQGKTTLPTVKFGDIATFEVVKQAESLSRTNGEQSIGLQIVKSQEANTVDVVNKVKSTMEKLEKDYGFKSVSTFDQAEPIEDSVSLMLEKALFGIIFAVIVILLFLRNLRTTLISIVSIPLSLLMAIFFLNQMGVTLNILTLGALTVAIGRVIDDSIVVMENIYRRMHLPDEPLKGKALIREATMQMFMPIFSSTLVTIVVFLPLVFVGGMVGEMFLPFALAVMFALAASLLVAVSVVPMLAHSLFKNSVTKPAVIKESRLSSVYKRILEWTLNHKIITFGSASLLLVASLFLIPSIGVSFLPADEQKMIMATYSPDPAQTRDQVEKNVFAAEEIIDSREGVSMHQFSIGGGNSMGMGPSNDNSALFFIEYDKDFKEFTEESTALIEKLNEDSDAGEWNSLDFSGMGSNLEIFVYGDDIDSIEEATKHILPIIEKEKEIEKLDSSIEDSYDQYTLVANQKKLSESGLSVAQVGMALNNASNDKVLTTVTHKDEKIDVKIAVEEETYQSIEDLLKTEIPSPLGAKVKLKDVLDIKEGKSPESIDRRDGRTYASINGNIASKDVAGISADLEKSIDKLDLPKGVKVNFGGVTEQINESFTQLGMAMLAAIAIIYFVLVVTFSGGLAPFAILFSLPFTIIGSLTALWIAGEPLSVSVMIGGLMLIGIVVTNAIVLVDRVIRNEKDGLVTRDALLEAGSTRLRPILMTALATIGALVPLLFGMEGGGLISKGLGITVIGGLISSTLLTLVIVPVVYETLNRRKNKKK